jgi:transcriptional regulator with XRE-family HTH domain
MTTKIDDQLELTRTSLIIKQLMKEGGMREAELARQTQLPQTTINRLLLGETLDPRANTLIPLAKIFGVTLGQLMGLEPLNPYRIPGTINAANKSAWSTIPIIEWNQAKSWVFEKNNFIPSSHSDWITTEKGISEDSFGLKTVDCMEPRFRKGSIVIVDPFYNYQDGNFIIICFGNAEPAVRRVMKDGSDIYLRKLYGAEELVIKQESDTVLGTIVETRINEK